MKKENIVICVIGKKKRMPSLEMMLIASSSQE